MRRIARLSQSFRIAGGVEHAAAGQAPSVAIRVGSAMTTTHPSSTYISATSHSGVEIHASVSRMPAATPASPGGAVAVAV